MTVLGFMKGVLALFCLFGAALLGIGVWQIWSAYDFESHAEKREGTFKGYLTVTYPDASPDENDPDRGGSRGSLPMFSYTDALGNTFEVTGSDDHLFEHLKFGQRVVVLLSPDASAPPRLGDILSLYGGGLMSLLVGTGILALILYGMKGLQTLMGPGGMLQGIGLSRLPIGDMAIMIGGFFLLAAVVAVSAYHWTLKRQDPALIQALQSQRFDDAFGLAADGRGIDAKTARGETALITALKAGRMDVALAILSCVWVNGNVYSAEGESAAQLASRKRDAHLLGMLLKRGALTSDIQPSVIHDLIMAEEIGLLRPIFTNGYDLHQVYKGMTFGDLALVRAKTASAALIRERQGRFDAPPAFVALAVNDAAALAEALRQPGAREQRFHGLSLEQYARRVGRSEMLPSFP